MLTLHESLLLFALHDDRGTVHSRAWLGLPDALRGAVVAEWQLRGHLEVTREGLASWTGVSPNSTPLLDGLRATARGSIPSSHFELDALLTTLEAHVHDLRGRVEASLVARGALMLGAIDRLELEDTPLAHGTSDDERAMVEVVRATVARVATAPRRHGVLVALADALDLWPVLLPPSERGDARTAAAWVRARDPISRTVHARILDRQGLLE
ncbi:MAG: GPP34 family phosphoprotein [Alphaproteobacteria bacterium]|nr:GPP34 family phosphoprotein [Alphaproteobacteria bacterium]